MRDTIHLRGKVVDALGKPVQYTDLQSRATDKYDEFHLGAQTNKNGFFEIRGAFLNDTIQLEPSGSNKIFYQNKGSRFITILLPHIVSNEMVAEVQAERLKTREVSSIRKYKRDGFICNYPSITVDADYPGGSEAFQKFISASLKYPEPAIKHNIEGSVKIKFKVLKDGSLSEFGILDGLGYGCDEEALRVLELSRKWKPAVRSGRPIEFEQIVSVSFKLED